MKRYVLLIIILVFAIFFYAVIQNAVNRIPTPQKTYDNSFQPDRLPDNY